ncbi:MAG TPA: DinB family protein [Vicinamibacterales bacterium]|nr:DinB family protein [Vicinamibacterales bacterium]
MSTTLEGTTRTGLAARIINEGYGTGAWHGPDLKAALADVTSEMAFWRPGPDRHNIAEIALHHAYCVRNVRAKLTGVEAAPFVLEGDDWFPLPDASRLSWSAILGIIEQEQARLAEIAAGIDAGRVRSALSDPEQVDIVLGITCHAVYHAGQIQLIKKLRRSLT